MKKRGYFSAVVFLVLFSILFYSGIASAVNVCSTANQTILTLYSDSNSHAAVFNNIVSDSNAQAAVCYDDIFGSKYTDSTNPWICDSFNFVVNLTAEKNAHLGKVDALGHNTPICYGNLRCSIVSGNSCTAPEIKVIGLTSESNAHASIPSIASAYSVCCIVPPQATINEIKEVYWADANGDKIPSNIQVYVNKTVQLVAKTTFAAGQQINFNIYEKDPLSDDDIRLALLSLTDTSGTAFYSWKITDADIEKAREQAFDEDRNEQIFEFYFNASALATSNVSAILLVNNSLAPANPPRAKICSPEHRQIYFISSSIEFEDCSTVDGGSIVSTEWTIDEDNSPGSGRLFAHTFTSAGQKTITLKVTSDSGLSSETQIAILLISNNNGLLGFINKPFHKEIVNDPTRAGVSFSANDSYVINNSIKDCNGIISCFAGNCPQKTMNPYPYGSPVCTNNMTLSGNTNLPFTPLYFNWTSNEGLKLEGFGKVEGIMPYSALSANYNDKWIKLLLSYDNAPISLSKLTNRTFTLLGSEQCIISSNTGVFIYSNNGLFDREVPINQGGCVGNDGIADGSSRKDDCCPSGQYCVSGGGIDGSLAGCVFINRNPATRCGEYLNQSTCVADADGAAKNPLNPERAICGKINADGSINICHDKCVWENKTSANDFKCYLNVTVEKAGEKCTNAACLVSSRTLQECNEQTGFFTLGTEVVFEPSGNACASPITAEEIGCISEEIEVPCVKSVQLPFFGNFQIILIATIIVLIYASILIKTHFSGMKNK